MFRVEEDKKNDFLTQKDFKRPELHKVETEFKDISEEEREGQVFSNTESVTSNNKGKVDTNIVSKNYADKIRMKIRFDYRGATKPARFFFRKKSIEEAAEELRDQKMSLWQNIPLQGIEVEDIKVFDIYTIVEEYDDSEEEVAYAPIEIILSADSLEDCVYLVSREEFRRIEIMEPSEISLNSKSLEKMFIKFSDYFRRFYEEFR